MTADQLRTALDRIGLSQVDAAKVLQVNDRSMRRWVLGERPIPHATAVLLRLLSAGVVSLDDVKRASKRAAS